LSWYVTSRVVNRPTIILEMHLMLWWTFWLLTEDKALVLIDKPGGYLQIMYVIQGVDGGAGKGEDK
jgi:hypothetical protein